MLRFLPDSGWGRLGKEKEQFPGKTISDLNFAKTNKSSANSSVKLTHRTFSTKYRQFWSIQLLPASKVEDLHTCWLSGFTVKRPKHQEIVYFFPTGCWMQKWTFLSVPKIMISQSLKISFPCIDSGLYTFQNGDFSQF